MPSKLILHNVSLHVRVHKITRGHKEKNNLNSGIAVKEIFLQKLTLHLKDYLILRKATYTGSLKRGKKKEKKDQNINDNVDDTNKHKMEFVVNSY